MERVFIVHGWDGSPNEKMHAHLTEELTERGFEVHALKMPNSAKPEIKAWVNYLSKSVGEVSKNDYFIGHSIGCQAVLRYLAILNPEDEVGGVLLIAPYMRFDKTTLEEEGSASYKIAAPWMSTPINWERIKEVCSLFTCIYSDDDPYVSLADKKYSKKTFKHV